MRGTWGTRPYISRILRVYSAIEVVPFSKANPRGTGWPEFRLLARISFSERGSFFFCNDEEAAQVCLPKRSSHCYIGGVPAGCHEDAAHPGLIVSSIESPPATA